MRLIHAALLGGGVGAVLGLSAGVLWTHERRGTEEHAPARAPTPDDEARPVLAGPSAEAVARRAATTIAVDLAAHGRRRLPPEPGGRPTQGALWRTLAGALLAADDPREGLAVLAAALAAGITLDEIGGLLEVLDPPRARAILRWLHPLLAGRPASPWLVARAAEAAGLGEVAFERGLEALRTGPEVAAAVALLVRIDAARAEAAVKGLAVEKAWSFYALEAAAGGFRDAAADEVAQRLQAEANQQRAKDADAQVERQRAAAEAAPEDPQSWSDLGHYLRRAGRSEEAAAAYLRSVQLDPVDEESLISLARLDPKAALPFLEEAAKRSLSAEVVAWLVRVRLRLDKPAAAMEALFTLSARDLEAWWDAGVAGIVPQAALVRLDGMLKSPRALRSGLLHMARGDALAALGRKTEAFDAYARALREGNANGYDFEGDETVRRMVALDAAGTETFLRAMPEDPQQLRVQGYARVAAAQGHMEGLRAILEPWSETNGDALAELGALLGSPWRERVYQAARERPDDISVLEHLARMEQMRGRVAEARAAYERALVLDPDSIDLAVRRALLR